MKVHKGQKRVEVPPYGMIETVILVRKDGCQYAMMQVHCQNAVSDDEEVGEPRTWSIGIGEDNQHIILYPTPDADIELKVWFYGPLQVA
jgi:hypothetical protein